MPKIRDLGINMIPTAQSPPECACTPAASPTPISAPQKPPPKPAPGPKKYGYFNADMVAKLRQQLNESL
jgi:hypothetical protein